MLPSTMELTELEEPDAEPKALLKPVNMAATATPTRMMRRGLSRPLHD